MSLKVGTGFAEPLFIAALEYKFVQGSGAMERGGGHLTENCQINSKNLIGKKVLVVDDISDNRLLESLFLKKAGAEVEYAANGFEAVEVALREDPDAILMDLHMPMMDGIGATARLRDRGYRGPIIAVTADCQQMARKRAFEVGFDDYLSKPLTFLQLMVTLSRFCMKKSPEDS